MFRRLKLTLSGTLTGFSGFAEYTLGFRVT
jgi:hypothetical protein